MTMLIPGADHVEVPYDKPGLCPECLDLWIDGRGGGKVQLVERDGKWVCPRGGASLVQQFGPDGARTLSAVGALVVLPTISLSLGAGWWLTNIFGRWRRRKDSKTE